MAARPTARPSPGPPSQTPSTVNSSATCDPIKLAGADYAFGREALVHQLAVAGLECLELEHALTAVDPAGSLHFAGQLFEWSPWSPRSTWCGSSGLGTQADLVRLATLRRGMTSDQDGTTGYGQFGGQQQSKTGDLPPTASGSRGGVRHRNGRGRVLHRVVGVESTVTRPPRPAGGLRPRGGRTRHLLDDGESILRPLLRHLSRVSAASTTIPRETSVRSLRLARRTRRQARSANCCPSGSTRSRRTSPTAPSISLTPGSPSTSAETTERWTRSPRCTPSPSTKGRPRARSPWATTPREDLPYYYALADAFTLCDGYHCSVMGPTHPNRLMQMSGTIDPAGKAGARSSSPTAIHRHYSACTGRRCLRCLRMPGISWKYYNPAGALYSIELMRKLGLTTDSVLPYFSQYENPKSTLYQKAFLQTLPEDFAADVRAGTLPKVSWISTPVGIRRASPAPSFLGEWFTDQVLKTLISNPDVWSKTVLFHMYDENDGFFDHVDPPVAPREPRESTCRWIHCPPMQWESPVRSAWGSGSRSSSSHRSAAAVTSAPTRSTTHRNCASSRSGSGSRPRTSQPGGGRPSATSPPRSTSRMRTPRFRGCPRRGTTRLLLAAKGCAEGDLLEIATNQPPYPRALGHRACPPRRADQGRGRVVHSRHVLPLAECQRPCGLGWFPRLRTCTKVPGDRF